MKRENGYYWVKVNADSEWTVARWFFDHWNEIGIKAPFQDDDFYAIDDLPMKKP